MNKITFEEPKPRTYYYHYSRPESQGALITQTHGFPKTIDGNKYYLHDVYQDRISEWYPNGWEKASEMLNTSMPYALPNLSDDDLKEFAKRLFELNTIPIHVRVIYYYNVATGYDCSFIMAISKKDGE